MTKITIIPQDHAQKLITDALSALVGRGKKYSSSELLEDATGIPARTIDSYRQGAATPMLANYLSLCVVLGTPFFNHTLGALPFTVSSTEPSFDTLERLLADQSVALARIAEILVGGGLDHRAQSELISVLEELKLVIDGQLAALRSKEGGAEC